MYANDASVTFAGKTNVRMRQYVDAAAAADRADSPPPSLTVKDMDISFCPCCQFGSDLP